MPLAMRYFKHTQIDLLCATRLAKSRSRRRAQNGGYVRGL